MCSYIYLSIYLSISISKRWGLNPWKPWANELVWRLSITVGHLTGEARRQYLLVLPLGLGRGWRSGCQCSKSLEREENWPLHSAHIALLDCTALGHIAHCRLCQHGSFLLTPHLLRGRLPDFPRWEVSCSVGWARGLEHYLTLHPSFPIWLLSHSPHCRKYLMLTVLELFDDSVVLFRLALDSLLPF